MRKKKAEGDDDAYILFHPVRIKIVELLKREPIHVYAITKELDMKKGIVMYHLQILEEHGFLTSKYDIWKLKGRTRKIFTVTEKVDTVLAKFKDTLIL